jgi:hypothetical protein
MNMSIFTTHPGSASWHGMAIEGASASGGEETGYACLSITLRGKDFSSSDAKFFLESHDREVASKIADAINKAVQANPRPQECNLRWSGVDSEGNAVVGEVLEVVSSLTEARNIGLKHAKGVRNLKLWITGRDNVLYEDRNIV